MAYNNKRQSGYKRKQTQSDPGSYGREQPQDLELEKRVLGALLIDSSAYSTVCGIIRPETFYDRRNQYIYTAIESLGQRGLDINIVTVQEELRREWSFEKAGGMEYTVEVSSHALTSVNVDEYANTLKRKHTARQLIILGNDIVTKAYDAATDIDNVLLEAERTLHTISEAEVRQSCQTLGAAMTRTIDTIARASQDSGTTGLPSGFRRLDEATNGWQPSDLIILAGRPAVGKTAFALSAAKSLAVDNNIPTAVFSLEASSGQIAGRLLSNILGIDGTRLQKGDISQDEWSMIDGIRERMDRCPLYIDDDPSLSILDLAAKSRKLVAEKDVRMIIIDCLQLMRADGMKAASGQEESHAIAKSLKALAKELNVPILAVSQLNPGPGHNEGERMRPHLSDLRETGAMDQDADMVVFIHRDAGWNDFEPGMSGRAEAIIAKNRKGRTGIFPLSFKSGLSRFEDYEQAVNGNPGYTEEKDGEHSGNGLTARNHEGVGETTEDIHL